MSTMTGLRRPERGQLRAFVLQHADLAAASPLKEADRLRKLAAKTEKLRTTTASVAQLIYVLRKNPPVAATSNVNGNGHASVEPKMKGSDALASALDDLRIAMQSVEAAMSAVGLARAALRDGETLLDKMRGVLAAPSNGQ